MRSRPLRSTPKVTVVIPCYNYGHYLPDAVGSAFTNPTVDVSVVIADNCSTDDSLDVAHRLAEKYPSVTVTEQPYNKPYLVNYNESLANVSTEYVVVLDADDQLTPGSITRSVALMEANPQVAFVYGHCTRFSGSTGRARTHVRSWMLWDGPDWAARLYRRGRNILLCPEILMRTSALQDAGLFDTDHPTGSDMLLWLQMALSGGGVGRINSADQAFYRVHERNMHFVKDSKGLLTDLTARRLIFDLALERASDRIRPEIAESLRNSARQAVAGEAAQGAQDAFDDADPESNDIGEELADFARETWPGVDVPTKASGSPGNDTPEPAWRTATRKRVRTARHEVGIRLNRYLEW